MRFSSPLLILVLAALLGPQTIQGVPVPSCDSKSLTGRCDRSIAHDILEVARSPQDNGSSSPQASGKPTPEYFSNSEQPRPFKRATELSERSGDVEMAVRAAVKGSVQRRQETADDGSDGYNQDYDTTDEEGDGDDQTEDDGDDGDDGDDSDSGDEGLSERDGEPDDVGDQGDDQDSDTGAIEDDDGDDQSDDSDDGQRGVEQDADQEGDDAPN